MSPLFGGNNDDMKKVGEDMQKLSEQIGALQQKLAAKTSEADSLRTQAAQGAGATVALEDAEAQMEVLRNQLKEMQNKPAQSSASQRRAGCSAFADPGAPEPTFRASAIRRRQVRRRNADRHEKRGRGQLRPRVGCRPAPAPGSHARVVCRCACAPARA